MPRAKINVFELVDNPNYPQGMAVLIARYLEWMRTKNYSEKTVLGFQGTLARFVVWAEERGVVRPNEVTKPIMERYQRYLFHLRKPNGAPLSFKTQSCCLTALRTSDLDMPRLGRRFRFIQAFLGHARLQTTEIYTQVSIRQLKAIHAACHPSAKLKRPEKSAESSRTDISNRVE